MYNITPKVNYGLWVIMMCQCGLILSKNNVPFWQVMLIMGEVMHVWEPGVYKKSLYLPLNFAINLKLL